FVFHHGNAFEREDQTIVLDSICYPSFPEVDPDMDFRKVNFEAMDPGQLWRFTLNLQGESVQRELLSSRCVEFPALHPHRVGRNYRYLYLGTAHNKRGNAPLQGILKMDLHTQNQQLYSFAPKGYVGEPIFVPKPGSIEEDAGWLLVMVYDAGQHRSDLVILDAQQIEQGAIARLHLRYHIPYGLHGSWTPVRFL
ncbi:MAG: Apocarotenoid-15,15'-oxygenase, partial [Kamptonema sp. SIO4C4]|nr:Apocarotenoid-15,15'-oxygenase [Kamptonema sp. SIO4C4]